MSIKFKIMENNLGNGNTYFTRALLVNKANEEKLLDRMEEMGTGLARTDMEAAIKLLVSASMKLLSEGCSVTIDNFIQLRPVIKSSFAAVTNVPEKESMDISIHCKALDSFTDSYRKMVEIEKTDAKKNIPLINGIFNGAKKENFIRYPHFNTVKGYNLKPMNKSLKAIHLFHPSIESDCLQINAEDLLIEHHTKNIFVFIIRQDYPIPGWLTPGLPIHFRLEYANGNINENEKSNVFKTYWQSPVSGEVIVANPAA